MSNQKKPQLFEDSLTRVYLSAEVPPVPESDGQQGDIPAYKYILANYDLKYRAEATEKGIRPLSLNALKTKYGLPNNSNDYFNVQPGHPQARLPRTISEKHAYILLLFYCMSPSDANLFLEALRLQRLDSAFATPLAKGVHYCLRQGYTLEDANDFLIGHFEEGLY